MSSKNPGVPGYSLKNEAVFSHLKFTHEVKSQEKSISFYDAILTIEVDSEHK